MSGCEDDDKDLCQQGIQKEDFECKASGSEGAIGADTDTRGESAYKFHKLGDSLTEISETKTDLTGIGYQVVNTLRDWYIIASESISTILEGRLLSEQPRDLWLLGKHYELDVSIEEQGWFQSYPKEILDDFSRLIWCTYRSQYPPITPSAFTTDAGWGCMLRAGQTLLAQALQMHYFGRDWMIDWDVDHEKRMQYIEILKRFFDDYAETSSFSIHRMASLGKQREGKSIGEWFGPYGTANIIKELALKAEIEVSIYTTTDGVVYLADICNDDVFKPVLILSASMLGIESVNPVYYPFIQVSLTLPQSVGIAGGKPSSALYFSGFHGDELLYLDPHFTRPAVAQKPNTEYTKSDLASYNCDTPRKIRLQRLDPCMVFGYYCKSLESLIDLRSRIELLVDDGIQSPISFDNGHAPHIASRSQSPLPPHHSRTSIDNEQLSSLSASPQQIKESRDNDIVSASTGGLLVKISSSDSDEGGVSVYSNSDNVAINYDGDIVFEGDCSGNTDDDEWVTDL